MEVRRNTRTSPTVGRQQFAQAEQTDYRPLLQGATDLRAGLDAGRRRRQSYELQKRLLEESNALAADLEQKRRDPSRDPLTIGQTADSEYTDRVNAVVEEYRMQGYDVDLVDDFFVGMSKVRNSLSDTALKYQLSARSARAVANAETLLAEGTKTVMSNKDAYEETARFIEDTLELDPDLTEEERSKYFSAVRPTLRAVAAESWAKENPEEVLSQLDPEGRWRQEVDAPVTGSALSVVAPLAPDDPANRVINYVAKGSTGLSAVPESIKTLGELRDFQHGLVKANTRAGVPDDKNSSAVGVYQIVGRTLENYAKELYGDDWKNEPFDFTRQDAIARAIFDDNKGSASALQKQWVSLTLEEAERIRKLPWEEARKLIARKESNAIMADVAPGTERVPQPGDVVAVDPGVPQSAISEFDTTRDLPPADAGAAPADSPPPALHPVLRDLTGDERLSLLTTAYAATRQNTAEQKAALDVLIENVKAEALSNGEVVSVIPTEQEIMSVYGKVAGPQIIADLNKTIQLGKSLKTYATLSPEQIATDVERLRPKPGSPTFATDSALYEAAQKAQAQLLERRNADPAGYVLANFPKVRAAADNPGQYYAQMKRALETLGFDPNTTSLLPKAAQERIVQQWPSMSPAARRQWFNETYNRMGEDQIKAFARGAEGTDMEQELKIYAFGIGRLSPATIEQIFAGRDALKKDPARRPPAEKITQFFRNSAFNGVLSMAPDASAALQDMAAALYVSKGGSSDPNNLGENLYKEALSQALGGALPYNDAKGVVKDYTILPRGITGKRFTDWVEQLQPGELSALSVGNVAPKYGDLKTSVTLRDIVDDGVFVMIAPDYYAIKMASDGGYLKTAQGKNFIVRLRPEDIK